MPATLQTSFRFFILAVLLLAAASAAGFLLHGTSTDVSSETAGSDVNTGYDSSETSWADYIWPLEGPRKRTSAFAEFRRTHFHAGIDMSTGMRKGLLVFASRSGWLHSVDFEPGGYGWLLVLRHEDGYYTCYAHLDSFPDRIRDAYRKRLVEMGKSYGLAEWDSGAVRVTKGEVVAYSGATGAGPPHLHFEVRDAEFNPVNPDLGKYIRTIDSIPPELRQLCFVPLDASSSVNGKYRQQTYNIHGRKPTGYTIRGTPVLRGRVGVMLRANDKANGASDYPTPYRISLMVDGKQFFTTTTDRVRDSLLWLIRIDRDHLLMKSKKGEFRKLFRDEGNALDFYDPDWDDAGVLSPWNARSGTRLMTIVAEDISGNVAMMNFRVMVAETPPVEVEFSRLDSATLRLTDTSSISRLSLEFEKNGKWRTMKQWSPAELVAEQPLKFDTRSSRRYRLLSEDRYGNMFTHLYASPGNRHGAGRLYTKREFHFDEIVYSVRSAAALAFPPVATITQGARSAEGAVYAVSPTKYRIVFRSWPGFTGDASVSIRYTVAGKEREWTDSFQAFHISSSEGGQIVSSDRRFLMTFAPRDVYRSVLCRFETNGRSAERRNDSTVYSIFPDDVPLAGRPVVTMSAGSAGKYAYVKADRPVRHYGAVNSASETKTGGKVTPGSSVSARFGRYLGRYRLARDNEPPVINAKIIRGNREAVRIHIADAGRGVDPASIRVEIDGKLVPVEFSERRQLYIVPIDVYRNNKGQMLTVSASDRLGNTISKKYPM